MIQLEQYEAGIAWDNEPPTAEMRRFEIKPTGRGTHPVMRILSAKPYVDGCGTLIYVPCGPQDEVKEFRTFAELMTALGVKRR